MNLFLQHPATRQLHRDRSLARLRRMLASFRSPRRAALSAFALVLSAIWIGQGIAGVFFREAADPIRLFRWVTIGLTGFAIWNVIKIVFRKPVEPFEWSDAEKEWLCASPLTRGQLIRYRIAGISAAALFKAGIFVLVMIPDLNFLSLGFVGLYLGLMFIEILRMTMEVLVYGICRKQSFALQTVFGAVVLATLAATGNWFYQEWNAGHFTEIISLSFVSCAQEGLQLIPQTAVGSFVCAPFAIITSVMLSSNIDFALCAKTAFCILAIPAAIVLLQRIDSFMVRSRQQLQRSNWKHATRTTEAKTLAATESIRRAPSGAGVGALVWRQWMGVRNYLPTVLFSLFIPLLFALGPAFGKQTGWALVQAMILLLGFWSFFLLPAALKFDFRRDLNRINVLKSLPMSPWKITVAQLVVPVFMTTMFQLTTFLVAMLINPFPVGYLVSAMLILLPFNVFIYAVENTAFLLYPYRLGEEGVQMFIRTILAFTAKGVLLGLVAAVGLGLFLISVIAAKYLPNSQSTALILFSTLSVIVGSVGSATVVWLLAKVFGRIDPSYDLATVDS